MSLDYMRVTSTETQILAPSGGSVALKGNANLGSYPVENHLLTNDNTAGAITLTAAMLKTGLITRDPNGANRTDTFDTAANILAAIPALANDGDIFRVYLINTADAAETITLAVAAGLTIANVGQTLAQNEAAMLLLRRTSSTTIVVYIVGA